MHAMCNRTGKVTDFFLSICRKDTWEANQAKSELDPARKPEEAGREGVGVRV